MLSLPHKRARAAIPANPRRPAAATCLALASDPAAFDVVVVAPPLVDEGPPEPPVVEEPPEPLVEVALLEPRVVVDPP